MPDFDQQVGKPENGGGIKRAGGAIIGTISILINTPRAALIFGRTTRLDCPNDRPWPKLTFGCPGD
jgi:hypothetical protein